MTKDYFRLLGLNDNASRQDVKKAYRAMAKANHPDRFTDDEQKKRQEKRMIQINEAYQAILSNMKDTGKDTVSAKADNPDKLTDTEIYKKGVAFFNQYNGSVSLKFKESASGIEELLEKKKNIESARNFFQQLLREYPDSDWTYDSEERIKVVDKNLKKLGEKITFLETHTMGWTKKGTPIWKEKSG